MRLFRYDRFVLGHPLPSPVWVAHIESFTGVVLVCPDEPIAMAISGDWKVRRKWYHPGEGFFIGKADRLEDGVSRELVGLDAAPPEVVAAWMKAKLLGKLEKI